MTGGRRRLRATLWLLDAPDSLAAQSRRNPDDYGIGTFADDGAPEVQKRPAMAAETEEFARRTREECSRVYVAHVPYVSTGGLSVDNTQPFELDRRLLAHNGHIEDLGALEERVGGYGDRINGETDSERFFALISGEVAAHDGDVEAGIAAAVGGIADGLPLFALSFTLATPDHVWALRYPDSHRLWVLEWVAEGPSGHRRLDAASAADTVRVSSGALADRAAVIFASEPMYEDESWTPVESGDLVHVNADLEIGARRLIDRPPAKRLRLEDLELEAAASQREPAGGWR